MRLTDTRPPAARNHAHLMWRGPGAPRLSLPLDQPHSGTGHAHLGGASDSSANHVLWASRNSSGEVSEKAFALESLNFPTSFWNSV